MTDIAQRLLEIVPAVQVLADGAITDDYTHDESLTCVPERPAAVVLPVTTEDVVAVLRLADELRLSVTARGGGTGLSGGCVPSKGGILLSFERMNRILEIDTDNQVAVVQPGVTLAQLDEVTAAHGLVYPVFPGESSASLGGNVATNAGGMRAVKYGVTRHQVLGLEAVLATGEVIRTGGRFVKATSGYDLTQLIVGSEGTLAVVTEVVLRLYPRPAHSATVLVPFRSITEIATAVPRLTSASTSAFRQRSRTPPLPTSWWCWRTAAPIGSMRMSLPSAASSKSSGRWTCTCCRQPPQPNSWRPGRRHSGWPSCSVPTTSSTWWCPGHRSPATWRRCRTSPKSTPAPWPVPGTRAMAMCTCRSSSPMTRSVRR